MNYGNPDYNQRVSDAMDVVADKIIRGTPVPVPQLCPPCASRDCYSCWGRQCYCHCNQAAPIEEVKPHPAELALEHRTGELD